MDQGISLPFSSAGIDDATFGMPTFADGWKGLIITGSSQKAIKNNNGGRLILHVKCGMDPTNLDVGKEHLISLNLWHNDQSTKDRAAAEMASIIRAIFGMDRQINNTAELYNQPFLAKAVTQVPAPTPEYPTPTPQTNWRGYATKNGLGVGVDGPAGRLGTAGAGAGPSFTPQQPAPAAPAFQPAPAAAPAPAAGGWGAPAAPAPAADPNAGGGWGQPQQPATAPAPAPAQNGWGAPAPTAPAAGPWG